MAFASSRIGAQEAMIQPCDLCEDDEDVNWFCKDCIQYLCERCKKMHLKIAICKDHGIVTALEGVAIIKKNVSNACQDHGEHFTFFCQTCDKNICSMCLSVVHKKHDFVDLRSLHLVFQIELENTIQGKEDQQLKMTTDISELEKCASQISDTLTKRYALIDDRLKAIHTDLDEEGGKLKATLKDITDKRLKEVRKRQRKIEGMKDEYEEKINTVKQDITLQTTSTFVQFVETSTSELQSLKPRTYPIPMGTRFTAGRTSQSLIMEMIGNIDDKLDIKKDITIFSEFHIVKTDKVNVKAQCSSICLSPDGYKWIGGEGYVYRMSSDFSTVLLQIPTRENFYTCNRITCLQSGDAVGSYDGWFPCMYVDRFTTDGKRVEFTCLSGRHACDIAVTDHDEVVVGVSENSSSPIVSLVIYSKEGERLNEITLDTEAQVKCFCINNDGNYIISDGSSNRLTTLECKGTVLKGIQALTDLCKLTCDRYGNILGLPCEFKDNKEVHLISDDGKAKRSFVVECKQQISDICIEKDDRLLILSNNKTVVLAEYLY